MMPGPEKGANFYPPPPHWFRHLTQMQIPCHIHTAMYVFRTQQAGGRIIGSRLRFLCVCGGGGGAMGFSC